MTEPDKNHRPSRWSSLGVVAAWAGALLLAGFIALAMHSLEASNRRLADGQAKQQTVISRLSTGLDTTRQQLQQHGVTPSAPPAQSIVHGTPGAPGETGAQGIPGPISTVPGPSGPPGAPGADSTVPGPAGSPGADSTVPGPAGSPGAVGAQGDPGPAGPAGKDGTDGKDGAPGAPPAGWTYTDPSGRSYSCSPVADFDPSSPRYTCSETTSTPPPESPSSGRGLLGVVALAATGTYRRW